MTTKLLALVVLAVFGAAHATACAVPVPLGCTFAADLGMEHGSVCNTTALATPLGTVAAGNRTIGHCAAAPLYTVTVPGAAGDAPFLVTMAAFARGAVSGSTVAFLPSIAVELSDGRRVRLGTFVPDLNTVVGPALDPPPSQATDHKRLPVSPMGSAASTQYPHNGLAFCNATFSTQVWDLRGVGGTVVRFHIADPTGALRLHAAAADTCAASYGPTTGSAQRFPVAEAAAVALAPASAGAVLPLPSPLPSPTWATCAEACRTAGPDCERFILGGGTCTLLRSAALLTTAAGVAFVGYRTQVPLPASPALVAAGARALQVDRYAAVGMATLFFPRYSGDARVVHRVRFQTLRSFAVGSAQTHFTGSGDSVLAMVGPNLTYACGAAGMEGGALGAACDAFRFCRVAAPSAAWADELLSLVPPRGTACASELTTGLVLHYDGTRAPAVKYSYARVFGAAMATANVTADIAAWHGAVPATLERHTASGLAAYAFGSTAASPPWRWFDADGLQRSEGLLCELVHPPGYEVQTGVAGVTAGETQCGTYSTVAEAAKACDASNVCVGFATALQAGVERPTCLRSTVGHGANDAVATLYTKTTADGPGRLRCSVSPDGAVAATIRVMDTLPGARVVIRGDGATLGSCTTVAPAGACRSFSLCASVAVPAGVATLDVDFVPVRPFLHPCGDTVAAAWVTFDPVGVAFAPPASCFTPLVAAGCTLQADAAGRCTARVLPAVPTPATFCAGPGAYAVTAGSQATHAFIVADLSAMAAERRGAVDATVEALLSTGRRVVLGRIAGTATASMYSAAGTELRAGPALCADATEAGSLAAGTAQVFPIPSAARGPSQIIVRGGGVRIVSVSLYAAISGCPAYPVPLRRGVDEPYQATAPDVAFSGAAVAASTAVETWGACAALCGAEARCRAWSFSNASQCTLRGSVGQLAVGASAGSGGVKTALRLSALALGAAPLGNTAAAAAASSGAALLIPLTQGTAVAVGGTTALRFVYGALSLAFASPAVAGTFGSAAQAPLATTGTGCGAIHTTDWVTAGEAWNGGLQVAATAGTGCAAWALILSDGAVETALYSAAVVLPGGSTLAASLTADDASVASYNAEGVTIDDDGQVLRWAVPRSPAAATPPVFKPTGRQVMLCEITEASAFRPTAGTAGTGAYDCGVHTTVGKAVAACSASATCYGFATDAADTVTCLYSSASTQAAAGSTLYQRVAPRCEVRLPVAGMLEVAMTELGITAGAGEATVRLDGTPVARCGGLQPFRSGSAPNGAHNCDAFRTCTDNVILTAGTVRVDLPFVARGGCRVAHRALFTFVPAAAASTAGYGVAAALPNVLHLRTRMDATAVAIRGFDVTRMAVLVEQDRYECVGACSTGFAINASIGSTGQRCGGILGFHEGRGLTGACDTYYYCGATASTGGRLGAQAIASAVGAVSVGVTIQDPASQSSDKCHAPATEFRATVYTDGLLLGAMDGFRETRTLFGLRVDKALVAGSSHNTSLVSTAKRFELLKLQYPELDPVVYVDRLFPVTLNNDEAVSYAVMPLDAPYLAQGSKVLKTDHIAACIMDQVLDYAAAPRCRMRLGGNWVQVLIAQTAFSQAGQTVTVTVGDSSFTCGGSDKPFYGFQGQSGRCDTYFTCYDGPARTNEVVVTFARSVFASSCGDKAVALITPSQRELPDQAACTTALPFQCAPLGTCLSATAVCDGQVNCPNNQDEAGCSTWSFVINDLVPTCASSWDSVSATDATACQKYALARGATAFTVGGGTCTVYDCLNFESPSLKAKAAAAPSVALFIQASEPSAFKYCTDALHCSNNGAVQDTQAPCRCKCDSLYTGADCGALRDISLISAVYVVFPPGQLNGTAVSDTVAVVQAATRTANVAVSASNVLYSPGATAVELQVLNGQTGKLSDDAYYLLAPNVSARIVAQLTRHHALYVTASSVVGITDTHDCTATTLAGDHQCVAAASQVNRSRTVSVEVPAVTFASAAQWVRVDLRAVSGGATTVWCNHTDFVQSTNPLLSGPCAVLNKCVKTVADIPTATVAITLSSGINPSNQRCNARFAAESRVTVDAAVSLPGTTADMEPTFASESNGTVLLLAILLTILGILALVHFAVWFVWMRNRFKTACMAYLGPATAIAGVVLLLGAGVAYGLFIEGRDDVFSHRLLVEEYRDRDCAASGYSSLPSRLSYVPLNDKCHQANVIGPAQGVDFLGGVVPNGTRDVVYVRRGGTKDLCEAAVPVVVRLDQCRAQGGIFVDKKPEEQLFMTLNVFTEALAEQRIAALRVFNPPVQLPSTTTVQALTQTLAFNADPDRYVFAWRTQSESRPTPRGFPGPQLLIGPATNVPLAVTQNDRNPRRVRFVATFTTAKTLFSSAETTHIDSVPFDDQGITSNQTNVGTFFNGYGTTTQTTDADAYADAYSYSGVQGSHFDFGAQDDEFILSFWISANAQSRGVVWAVVDNWQSSTGEVPAISRLIQTIENGAETTPWFDADWSVYNALYVNGNTQTLHFVYTSGGVLRELKWDASFLGVERLFDGGWHYLALRFFTSEKHPAVQLFVDGETDYKERGWRHCLDEELEPVRDLPLGATLKIFNSRDETVRQGGLLVVGHINAGLWSFGVNPKALEHERLLRSGAPGMDLFAAIAKTESLVLGLILLLSCAVIALITLYQVWYHFFGIDADELQAERIERRKRVQRQRALGAHGGNKVEEPRTSRKSLFVQFLIPVMLMCQTFAVYFNGWSWPERYTDTFGIVYALLSLDVFTLFKMNIVIPVAAQFGLAILTTAAFLYLGIQDDHTYARVKQFYLNRELIADRTKTRRLELDRPKPTYRWVVFDSGNKPRPLEEEQQDYLQRGLHDLLTSTRKGMDNMRLHTKQIMKFPGIGSGILLYERREGKIGVHFRMPTDQALETGSMETALAAKNIHLTQITFECQSANVACPVHNRRLLRSDIEGISCVHNEAPYYRSVSCNPKATMYQCPADECMFAVCQDCWQHSGGAVDSAVTGAISALMDIRRKGVWRFLFRVIAVLATLLYLPAFKNAVLVLACHPTFQCTFGLCWSDVDLKYIVSMLLSLLVVVFVGGGLVLMEGYFVFVRRQRLEEILPKTQLLKRRLVRCLPQSIVKRPDWEEFLALDITLLRTLYEAYDHQWLWFAPLHLISRIAVVIAVVAATPNSLAQLSAVAAIELVYAVVVVAVSPYKHLWVEATVRLSSLHQLVQLGVFALHRVDLRNNPTEHGFANQMIIANALYFVLALVFFLILLVMPLVREKCCKDRLDEKFDDIMKEEKA